MRHIPGFLAALAASLVCLSAAAQRGSIRDDASFLLDRDNGQYALGDTVRLSARIIGQDPGPLEMTVYENGIRRSRTLIAPLTSESRVIYQDIRAVPTAVTLEIRPAFTPEADYEEEPLPDKNCLRVGYVCGAKGFTPGFDEPKDLRKWWDKQIRTLRRSPMKVKLEPVALQGADAENFECFKVEISALDSIPVRGYLAKPKGAAKGTLPVSMYLRAAGVAGFWCKANVATAMEYARMGAISLDINAHGMLNDAPDSYYRELEDGRLKGYDSRPIRDRESYYFRMMVLRAIRALDYVTSDPAWDGERVLVMGESQGGFQSAMLAGLDSRVSDVVTIVPAGTGTGESRKGRRNAWPWPLEHSSFSEASLAWAPYFDAALLLKGSKANCLVEAGLIDTTCPTAAVCSGYNGVTGEVTYITSPYRTHQLSYMPAQYRTWWDENVEGRRRAYIRSRLGAK